MSTTARRLVASLSATAMLVVAAVLPNAAQSSDKGLVDVSVGHNTVRNDVSLAAGARAAAKICDLDVFDVAVVANQIDRNGGVIVCETDGKQVRIKPA